MKLIELRQKILLIRLAGQYWSLNGKKIVLYAAGKATVHYKDITEKSFLSMGELCLE